MHTVSIEERNGEYRFVCTCGVTGNWYPTNERADEIGLRHKGYADGSPNS